MSTSSSHSSPLLLGLFKRIAATLAVALLCSVTLQAKSGSATAVGYAPQNQTVEGNIPFVQSVVFTITAPFASNNVSFEIKSCALGGIPTIGGAGSQYIGVSPQTLSFSAAGEVKQVVVTFTSPAPGVVAVGTEVSYDYQIRAIGWAGTVSNPDDHVSVNATATAPNPPVVANPPVVKINPPLNGAVYTVPAGQSFPISIPFAFTVTSTSDYPVISADGLFDGELIHVTDTTDSVANAYTPLALSNIGTAVATGSADLKIYRPGTYSVFARGANSVGPATDVAVFTVVASGPPPEVTISEPAPGSTYVIPANASSVGVPFNFTAATTTGGVITQIVVKLDGNEVPYSITAGALNSTLSVSGTVATPLAYGLAQAGSNHTISVWAINDYGEDTAVTNFNIAAEPRPPTGLTLSGVVFLDVNQNGIRDNNEPVIPGIQVNLFQSNSQIGAPSFSSAPSGAYSFTLQQGGDYELDVVEPAGLVPTNAPLKVKNVTASRGNLDLGLALNLPAIGKMAAGGYTIGYWKNNIEKAIAGKVGGTQVNAANIANYTTAIGTLALAPFTGLTREQAITIMGSTSSAKIDLLAKQLLASEYNYENGGYINGAQALTFAFVAWGEYVLLYGSDADCSTAQAWFNAYNNSHGGVIGVPK